MKKMINKDDSDENYNNYKLPNLDEGDIVEIMYTVKKDFNFNGNKIIEESYPILLSKFILIENNFQFFEVKYFLHLRLQLNLFFYH